MNINSLPNQSFGAIYKTKIDRKDVEKQGRFDCAGVKAVTGETINGYCTTAKNGEKADLYVFTGDDARILPEFMAKRNGRAMGNLYTAINSSGNLPSGALKLDIVGYYKSDDSAMDRAFIDSIPKYRDIETVSDYTHLYCSRLKP